MNSKLIFNLLKRIQKDSFLTKTSQWTPGTTRTSSQRSFFTSSKLLDQTKQPVSVLPASQKEFDGHMLKPELYPVPQVCKSPNVLIIENNFEGKADPLPGYKDDAKRLDEMWQQMGCKVKKLTNLSMQEMRDKTSQFATSKQHETSDYAVLVILSHGDTMNGKEVCLGIDNQSIPTNDIVEMFNGDYAPYLVGKPKLILLQYCKGVTPLPSVNIANQTSQVVPSHIRVPAKCDTMVIHATLRGHPAFVNDKGSYLVRNFVDVFSENARDTHVGDMMIKVREKVSQEDVEGCKQHVYNGKTQVCFVEDSTTKKLFLFPKVDRSGHSASQ